MRQKAKLVVFAALSAALTVAGLSMAAGGGSNGSKGSNSNNGPDIERGYRVAPGMQIDANVADVMRQIHDAVEKKEASIAEPIIKKAVDDGKITSAQADAIRNRRPDGSFDADVAVVLRDIHQAIAKERPAIAEPIIKKAVDDKKITSAQADDLRSKLKNVQGVCAGPPPFGGPGGPHWERRRGLMRPQGFAPGGLPRRAAPVQVNPA